MPTTILSQSRPSTANTQQQWRYAVVLQKEKNGPVLKRVEVADAELNDIRSEIWLDYFLRKGFTQVPLDALDIQLTPKFQEHNSRYCEGFVLETTDPAGETCRREYSITMFQDMAVAAAQQLVDDSVLQANDTYRFKVLAEPKPAELAPLAGMDMQLTIQDAPLAVMTLPISTLLEGARQVGPQDDRSLPVFYTAGALKRAAQAARSGAAANPPIESGAVLAGPVCSCPESGELFVVVCEVYELTDADGTEFSLAYTGKTWARLQAIMQAKQAQPSMRAYRFLGQCHGHNFLPAAAECLECDKRDGCNRTSVFVSLPDRTWSRAVFNRQPYQLCHVFGFNARSEEMHALYGLRDNRLQERGFYLIPHFDLREATHSSTH